jgi:hypothetical protein
VPESAIAPDIHEALDVHCHFTAQITLDPHLLVDNVANAVDFIVSQIPHTRIRAHIRPVEELLAGVEPDSKDIRQRRLDSLIAR